MPAISNLIRRLPFLTLASAAGVSFYYRPIGDNEVDKTSGPKRNGILMSEESLCDRANIPPPVLYRLASALVIFATTSVTRIFIYYGGRFKVKEDENYYNFVNRVRQREPGVPLITPELIRWSVCSQEFCFNPAYSSLIHAFSGLGKVMPIKRGAGINQKLLLDFARRLAAGDWCHVFPEGGIWQRPVLGGRENGKEEEIGHLKWGVGKLIAHSPQRAIVVPFFEFGMETTMPQHPVTKKLDTVIPRPGHDVLVQFGQEIDFDDLIREHEEVHGVLWKYTASVDEDKRGDFHDHWDSKPEELLLYHKITLRVEQSLAALNLR